MSIAVTTDERAGAARTLVATGLIGAVVYSAFGTWSAGRGFGGYGSDGGWIDSSGAPTSIAPLTAHVTGHPAPWVFVLLAAVLVGGHLWASRAEERSVVRSRYGIALGAAFALVLLAAVAYTGLQMWLVDQAFAAGSAHPVLIGNADLVVDRMPPG